MQNWVLMTFWQKSLSVSQKALEQTVQDGASTYNTMSINHGMWPILGRVYYLAGKHFSSTEAISPLTADHWNHWHSWRTNVLVLRGDSGCPLLQCPLEPRWSFTRRKCLIFSLNVKVNMNIPWGCFCLVTRQFLAIDIKEIRERRLCSPPPASSLYYSGVSRWQAHVKSLRWASPRAGKGLTFSWHNYIRRHWM